MEKMSSSSSPCAACKFLRQKCTQECVFAPYFPPNEPQKFSQVHKVFGASNVSKILRNLDPAHRPLAVESLAYEAEARIHNPVYGCVGYISLLQQQLKKVHESLERARTELSHYIGPSMITMVQPGFEPQRNGFTPNGFTPEGLNPYFVEDEMMRGASGSHNWHYPHQHQQEQQRFEQSGSRSDYKIIPGLLPSPSLCDNNRNQIEQMPQNQQVQLNFQLNQLLLHQQMQQQPQETSASHSF